MLSSLKKVRSSLKNKNSSGRMMVFASFAGMFSNAATIFSGLLVARWILPVELGLFNGFSILISYIILLQLGIPSGLGRNYPYYLGQDNKKKSDELAAVAGLWSLFLGIATLAVTFTIAIYYLWIKKYEYAAGIAIIGISSFQSFYVTKYLKILFRSNNDFNKLSIINIINAVVSIAAVVFVKYYGFYGLCLRALALIISDSAATWVLRPIKISPHWSKANFKELLQVGMPMFWVANLYSLWPILQRTLVLFMGGTKALGIYGIALMVENAMAVVASAISNIIAPKMAVTWGKTHRFNDIFSIALKPVIVGFFANIFLVAAGWLLLPFFIKTFVPNFMEGVTAARWSLVVGLIALLSVFSNVYMIIQKNVLRMISYLTGFAFWATCLFCFYKIRGFHLEIFPQSMCVAYIGIYMMDIYFFKRFAVEYKDAKTSL